ncbi:hypothetical protein J4437_05945 [Candidatus Woesearchaeota archaeon]|nr:hypothetical protein [Candidatus Woesearchaeota archaeon]
MSKNLEGKLNHLKLGQHLRLYSSDYTIDGYIVDLHELGIELIPKAILEANNMLEELINKLKILYYGKWYRLSDFEKYEVLG